MRKNLKLLGVLLLALFVSFAFVSCSEDDEDTSHLWQGRGIHYLLQGAWQPMTSVPSTTAGQRPAFFVSGSQMTHLSVVHKLSMLDYTDLRLATFEEDLDYFSEIVTMGTGLQARQVRLGRLISEIELEIGDVARRLVTTNRHTVLTVQEGLPAETPQDLAPRVDVRYLPIVGPVDLVIFEVQARTYDNARPAGNFRTVVDVSEDLNGAHRLVVVRDGTTDAAPHFIPPISGGFVMGVGSSWSQGGTAGVFTTPDLNMNSANNFYNLRLRFAEGTNFSLHPLSQVNTVNLTSGLVDGIVLAPAERFNTWTTYIRRGANTPANSLP